ncbi:CchlO [Kitasatospora albolonga]|uniref:CchlO n=1 Tax=Kitasatospora albolonga TaxID=68173 RepID=A0ABC8BKR5_9ACTN|nr:CchlO [Kitasatospora albolonga]
MSAARGRTPAAALVVALFLALLAAGCTGGGGAEPDTRSSSPSGTGAEAKVLAVKIDNVAPARPQTGLERADIVYVEQVEAGLSRLLAVYSSELPPVIGPVRSARETDLELLRQFDRPVLAFSGAQSRLLPAIDRAPLDAVPPSTAPQAYFRGQDRPAPHNLYLRPERIPYTAAGTHAVEALGLTFGPAPPGGSAEDSRTVRFPSARTTFTWSADSERWLVSLDGSPARTSEGEPLGAATVIVQDVTVRPSDFGDRSGNNTPFTETVGSGTAHVLRDGMAHEARWARTAEDADTEFTTPDGQRIELADGPLWIVYAPR